MRCVPCVPRVCQPRTASRPRPLSPRRALDLPDAGWIRPSASADLITVRGNTPDAELERLGAPDLVLIGREEVYRA